MHSNAVRRWLSSGLLRHVVWWKFTYVSDVLAASIIMAMKALIMEAESGKRLPDYTAQQPRRQPSSYSPPREPDISLMQFVDGPIGPIGWGPIVSQLFFG
jgi:hypothetical protein